MKRIEQYVEVRRYINKEKEMKNVSHVCFGFHFKDMVYTEEQTIKKREMHHKKSITTIITTSMVKGGTKH